MRARWKIAVLILTAITGRRESLCVVAQPFVRQNETVGGEGEKISDSSLLFSIPILRRPISFLIHRRTPVRGQTPTSLFFSVVFGTYYSQKKGGKWSDGRASKANICPPPPLPCLVRSRLGGLAFVRWRGVSLRTALAPVYCLHRRVY